MRSTRSRPAAVRPAVVVVLAAATVAVGHGFGRLSYPFLLPAMVDDLVGTYARAGLLGTANLAAYLVGLLVMIRLSARVRLADFLAVGLLGVVAGLVLLAVAPSYLVLVLGMVLAGGFNGALWVPASALAASAVSPRHRGLAAGALGVGSGLAIVLAGALSRGAGSWRTVWAVEAVLGTVVLLAVLRRLPRGALKERAGDGGPGLLALRHLPGWVALVVTYAAFALGYVLFTNYLVAALRDDAGFSPAAAAGAYSVLGLASIVGGLLAGRLSDLVGRRRVLLAAHVLMAACAAVVLLGSHLVVLVAAAVFGLFSTGLPAIVAAYVADHLEPSGVAAAFGVVTIAFGVTQTLAPSLGGFLADATGAFRWTFLVAAAAHAVGAVAAGLLPEARSAPATAR